MQEKKLGIGIVGCGTISGTHADAIKETTHGKLVAAYSRNSEKLEKFCKQHDCRGFTDYEEFLKFDKLNIVSICTPSGTHLDFAAPAAEAKKHVVIEKPVEVTLERGRSLIKQCRQNGVKLAIIYQSRFIDDIIQMRQSIQDGEIGDIVMVDVSVKWFRDQEYYSSAPWRGTFKLDGGGVTINQSIHTIDLIQWLVGDIESLSGLKGTFTHKDIEAEDNAVATFKFKNGAIGVFQASTSIVPPQERKIEIHGSKGTAILEGDKLQIKKSEDEADSQNNNVKSAGAASPLSGMTSLNHMKQYDQILDAILNNKEPVVSGEESLKSLAFVKALYTSANYNTIVFFDEFIRENGIKSES